MTKITFEELFLNESEVLRRSLDLNEYKELVLKLIFFKHVNNLFEKRFKELLDENEGFEEDPDFYLGEGIDYIPKNERWDTLVNTPNTFDQCNLIERAIQHICYPKLKITNRPTYANKTIEPILSRLITLLAQIDITDTITLPKTFDDCLKAISIQEAKISGEFYSPTSIVDSLINIVQPNEGRVYDPCCGSGGIFVQSSKFIETHSGNINDISMYGQEINITTWKIAKMNIKIHDIDVDLGEQPMDTFSNDLHPTLKADYIIACPPFNLRNWGQNKLKDDSRWKYGLPPKGNANYAWMQHMIHHLSSRGKIGLVLANGSLSSTTSGEGKIRQAIIEDDLVDAIITLPTQLFYSTGIPVSLWFLNKDKTQKGKTLFIDARELGTMVTRKQRELTDEDIQLMADTYNKYTEGTLEDEKGFCKVATIDDIKEQDYLLTPGRYVGFRPEEDDYDVINLNQLRKTNKENQNKINKLNKEIEELLNQL
ncbi:MAG: N-6 DNA methylase [Methanosphaera sp.]|nr:N-6 DNA methylase [Methanosphaera sp.]MBR0471641.1 N-6 DNA methylase [Methanosphaera sp.]